jgi:hypothetical protein
MYKYCNAFKDRKDGSLIHVSFLSFWNSVTLLLTYASETWALTKRDRKQLNVFERKVYRRVLGPVYDNEK